MKRNHLKKWVFALLIPIVLLDQFNYCTKPEASYPRSLAKAIDLFYLENKNDSVLLLLKKPELVQFDWEKNGDYRKLFMAAALCESNKIDSARTVYNSIVPVVKNNKFMYYYRSIDGLILFRENNNASAYEILLKTTNDKPEDFRALALNQRIISRILKSYTDHKSAIEWNLKSIENYEKAGLEKSAGVSSKFLAVSCVNVNHFEDAKHYLDRAKATFEKFNDPAELFYVHIILIDYYTKLNQLDSAAFHAQAALNMHGVKHDEPMKAHLYNNLGEIAMMRKNYSEALKMFQNTLDIPVNYYGKTRREQFAYLCMGKIFNRLNQQREAMNYLQKAQEIAAINPIQNLSQSRFEIYQELAKMYVPTDYKQAVSYIDSTVNQVKNYYASQNTNLINSFKSQKELELTRVNLEELKNKAKTRNISALIISVLTLTFIFILFIIIKSRQDRNKILKELVRKNVRLLEEERKLNQSIQEKRKCMDRNKVNPTDDERLKIIYSDLIMWLESDKNYQRNDLNLEMAAKEIGTNRDYLSRAINEHDFRFPDVVNKYRIDEVITILSSAHDKRRNYSLQNIAQEVGFNSSSVFIEAFRKHTSMTPGQFRERVMEVG